MLGQIFQNNMVDIENCPSLFPLCFIQVQKHGTNSPLNFFGSKQFVPNFHVVYVDLKTLDVEQYRGMLVLFLMSLLMKSIHYDDFLERFLEYRQEVSELFEKHDVYFHQFMVYIISYRKGVGMNDVKKIVSKAVEPYQLDPESILAGVLREREQMIQEGLKKEEKQVFKKVSNKVLNKELNKLRYEQGFAICTQSNMSKLDVIADIVGISKNTSSREFLHPQKRKHLRCKDGFL